MKENLKTIASALLLAVVIRIVLFEAFEIEGPSMEPSLLNGDRVVVAKFMYGLFLPFMDEAVLTWSHPDPADVVILKSPMDNIDIVKRVIGVAGDRIEVQKDRVFRNGKPIPRRALGPCRDNPCDRYGGSTELLDCTLWEERIGKERYSVNFAADSVENMTETSAVVVPEGHLFVLGDHRDHSNDSRFFGVVPVQRVKGKALSIYWSSHSAAEAAASGQAPGPWWSRIRFCRIGDPVR